MEANRNGISRAASIPMSSAENNEVSRRDDWLKIQSKSDRDCDLPLSTPKDTVEKPSPEHQTKTIAENGKALSAIRDYFVILLVLGGIVLVLASGVLTPDRSYREKMTPTQRYYDDLREEQEAEENRQFR